MGDKYERTNAAGAAAAGTSAIAAAATISTRLVVHGPSPVFDNRLGARHYDGVLDRTEYSGH